MFVFFIVSLFCSLELCGLVWRRWWVGFLGGVRMGMGMGMEVEGV